MLTTILKPFDTRITIDENKDACQVVQGRALQEEKFESL